MQLGGYTFLKILLYRYPKIKYLSLKVKWCISLKNKCHTSLKTSNSIYFSNQVHSTYLSKTSGTHLSFSSGTQLKIMLCTNQVEYISQNQVMLRQEVRASVNDDHTLFCCNYSRSPRLREGTHIPTKGLVRMKIKLSPGWLFGWAFKYN